MMFAIVELMGHRQRAGRISDATIGGATMLRIEHPCAEGLPGEPLTEYYAPSAIFSIRPCSEEMARAAAQYWRPPQMPETPSLASPLDELVDDDEYDDGAGF